MLLYLAAFIIVVCVPVHTYDSPTAEELKIIKQDIDAMFANSSLLPVAVRLAFHDCIGDSCDGCINLDDVSHAGLIDVVAELNKIYDGVHNGTISRADFWQLAALISLNRTVENAQAGCTSDCMPSLTLVARWGRVDCPTSPATTDLIYEAPLPTTNHTQLFAYFGRKFSFTREEVTALMGVHTLGGARPSVSGYSGTWTPGQRYSFDNRLYKTLVDASLSVTSEANDPDSSDDQRWQFRLRKADGADAGFRLPVDMALAYEMDVHLLEPSRCFEAGSCRPAATSGFVETFARNATAWMSAFEAVYEKLTSHGNGRLRDMAAA